MAESLITLLNTKYVVYRGTSARRCHLRPEVNIYLQRPRTSVHRYYYKNVVIQCCRILSIFLRYLLRTVRPSARKKSQAIRPSPNDRLDEDSHTSESLNQLRQAYHKHCQQIHQHPQSPYQALKPPIQYPQHGPCRPRQLLVRGIDDLKFMGWWMWQFCR